MESILAEISAGRMRSNVSLSLLAITLLLFIQPAFGEIRKNYSASRSRSGMSFAGFRASSPPVFL